jgi:hypothetical protein
LNGFGTKKEDKTMALLEKLQGLVTTLFNEREKLYASINSEFFSSKAHLEMRQQAYRKIVLRKNAIYDEEIERITREMETIKKKYAITELTPETELLNYKKIESLIKSLPDNELEQRVKDFMAGKGELLEMALKPDYVNVAVSELRNRGLSDLADNLHNHFFITMKGKEPYKLDEEYKRLEKELNRMESYKALEDAIMLTDGTELAPTTYYISQELGLSDIERPAISG